MKNILALIVLVASLAACPHPIPEGGTVARVVDCSKEALADQGIALIPAVNSCLVAFNASTCLLGLVEPGTHITVDLISCLVRSRGAEFSAAAQANPGDQLSPRAASNALRFIDDQGIRFAD